MMRFKLRSRNKRYMRIKCYSKVQRVNWTSCQELVGRGLRINFPVSSHDMLKSARTTLVRWVIIAGATTRLWIPVRKSKPRIRLDIVKNMWLRRESKKLTWEADVKGSLIHCQAPIAVQIDATTNIILHRIVPGLKHVITSVNLRSNAFKSVSVCLLDR